MKLICFLAKNISLGYYQNNGFLVLPYLERGNSRAIYFPNLGYSKEFWKAINVNSNNDLSASYSQKAIDEVKNSLKKYKNENFETKIIKIKLDWYKMEKDFFGDIDKFLNFGKALAKVEKINVLITPFGTRGSFNPPRVGNKFNLNVTSRVDFPAGNIAFGILQNLFIIDSWIGGEIASEKYIKRMAAMTFLMKSTIFSKYYPDFTDITKTKFTVDRDLLSQSNKYLVELGLINKNVSIIEKLNNLTTQEEKVLKVLNNNRGNYVTFDEIADVLWGNDMDDKFSLLVMSKVMENLRRKIREIGVNKEVIFTKRGKGYMIII